MKTVEHPRAIGHTDDDNIQGSQDGQSRAAMAHSRRGFLISAAALSAGLFAPWRSFAAEGEEQAAAEVASAPPQRVMASCTDDLAHSLSVTWRARSAIQAPQAQLAPFTAAPLKDEDALTVPAVPEAPFPSLSGEDAHHYALTFKDLQPGTQYCYRVGDGISWSEWNPFRTAETPRFRFLYFGDVQNDIRSMCTRTIRKAYQHASDARLALYAGDLVNDGWNDGQWDEFAYATSVLSPVIPALPTPGNHDTKSPTPVAYPYDAHPAYHAHFALPENGPDNVPGLAQGVYFLDYQGVRFISVNSNAFDEDAPPEVQEAQLAWLDTTLANNPNRWTVVTHHHPIYSVSEGRDNEHLRTVLRPIYDKYRVDVVLQGHDHTYGRTHKVAGDQVADAAEPGTIYVVSVAGPKMYEVAPKFSHLMAVTAGNMQMYQVVDVDHDRLRLDSYAIDGKRIDGFELVKDASGASTYSTT